MTIHVRDQPLHAQNILCSGSTESVSTIDADSMIVGLCVPRRVRTMYLAVTTNMGDLFLNAMALAFIIDVDSMIFGLFGLAVTTNSVTRSCKSCYMPV